MITRGPVFQIVPIDLSAAGSKEFNEGATIVSLVRAEDASGSLFLDAKVMLNLGDIAGDDIPMSINTRIHLRKPTNVVRFSWDAQPGVKAFILISGDDGISIDSPPPKATIFSLSVNTVSTAAYAVGVAPVLVAAVSPARSSVIIQNRGLQPAYIGGSDVSVSTGIRVNPGEVMTLDKTAAALYAICAWAGGAVNVLVEK